MRFRTRVDGPAIRMRSASKHVDDEAGPPGFEPGSEAPEAPMLSKLYYEPNEKLRFGT